MSQGKAIGVVVGTSNERTSEPDREKIDGAESNRWGKKGGTGAKERTN
jgi:hypothetical protein